MTLDHWADLAASNWWLCHPNTSSPRPPPSRKQIKSEEGQVGFSRSCPRSDATFPFTLHQPGLVTCPRQLQEDEKYSVRAPLGRRARRRSALAAAGTQVSWRPFTDGGCGEGAQVRTPCGQVCLSALLPLPHPPVVSTSAKNGKRGPRRGRERFPLPSDLAVLIPLLPPSATGVSTDRNDLKNSKWNLASDSTRAMFFWIPFSTRQRRLKR